MIDISKGQKHHGLEVTLIVILAIILVGLFIWPIIKPMIGAGAANHSNTVAAEKAPRKYAPDVRKSAYGREQAKPQDQNAAWLKQRAAAKQSNSEALGIGMEPEDVSDRDAVEIAYYMVPEEDGQRDTQLGLRLTPTARKSILQTSQYAFDNPPYTGSVKQTGSNTVQCDVKVTKDKSITITFARQSDAGWAATSISVRDDLTRPAPDPGT